MPVVSFLRKLGTYHPYFSAWFCFFSCSALHFEELISLQEQAVSLDVVLAGMGSYVVQSQRHGHLCDMVLSPLVYVGSNLLLPHRIVMRIQ